MAFGKKILNEKLSITLMVGVIFLLTGTSFSTTFFSNGSGNFNATSIWNEAQDGSGAAYTASASDQSAHDFVIDAGDVITLAQTTEVNNMTVDGTFTLTSNGYTFRIYGALTLSGTLNEGDCTIDLSIVSATNLTINSSYNIYNLTITGFGGGGQKVITLVGNSGVGGTETLTITNELRLTDKAGFAITTSGNISALAYSSSSLVYDFGTNSYNTGDEWPASPATVPNVVLQSGTVTIASGIKIVDTKLTRVNGSIVTTGTLQYSSAELEYAPSPAAAVNVGNEWPASDGPEDVTINNSGQTVTSATAQTVPRTLTLTAGTISCGSFTLTVLGDVDFSDVAGAGAIASTTPLSMGDGVNSQFDQTISGSITLNSLIINKETISDVVQLTGSLNFTGTTPTLTVTKGVFDANGKTITALNTLNVGANGTFQTGGTSLSGVAISAASGKFVFDGSSQETLPTNISIGAVEVDNTSNVATALGTLTVTSALTFTNGIILTTSANMLALASSITVSGESDTKYIDGPVTATSVSGSFDFPVGDNSELRNVVFTTGTGSGNVTASYENINPNVSNTPNGIKNISNNRKWTITPAAGISTYDVQLNYSSPGFTIADANAIRILRGTSSSSNWSVTDDTPTIVTGNTTVATNSSALSGTTPVNYTIAEAGGTITWDGEGSDGLWSTASNWVGDVRPVAGDAVLFDNSSVESNYSVSYDNSVLQTEFSSIQISSNGSYDISLTLDQVTTIDLTAASNALQVGSTDKLVYAGTSIIMGGASYDAGLTSYAGEVEYQSGSSVYVDTYGNLTINGASGTSGATGTVTVGGNLVKNSSTSFSSARPFTVSGNYTNTLGNATYSGGLSLTGNTFTVTSGTIGGTVTLAGGSAQTIEGSGGAISINNVTLNNSNGLTLNHPVIVAGTFSFSAGIVTTTLTNLLSIASTGNISGYGSGKYVDGPLTHNGTGTKFYPVGDLGEYRPIELVGLTGTDPVIRFEMVKANPGGTAGSGLSNISTIRYWSGSLTSGSITSTQVRLYWGSNDLVDASPENLADLAVATSSSQGGSYASAGNAGTSGSNSSGSVISSSLVNMQYFTLGSQAGDNSLPVELALFQARVDFDKILLEWQTASESENLGFNLYRKLVKEQDWNKINDELIAGQGNTSSQTNYEFIDNSVTAGEVYSYKLESVSYSGVIAVEKTIDVALPIPAEYVLYNNYPNPFNPLTHIKFQVPEFTTVTVAVYDVTGKLVKTLLKEVNYDAGAYVTSWDATNQFGNRVSSGLYFYRFTAGQFNKFGRMVLLK